MALTFSDLETPSSDHGMHLSRTRGGHVGYCLIFGDADPGPGGSLDPGDRGRIVSWLHFAFTVGNMTVSLQGSGHIVRVSPDLGDCLRIGTSVLLLPSALLIAADHLGQRQSRLHGLPWPWSLPSAILMRD